MPMTPKDRPQVGQSPKDATMPIVIKDWPLTNHNPKETSACGPMLLSNVWNVDFSMTISQIKVLRTFGWSKKISITWHYGKLNWFNDLVSALH